jgi:MYND finger
MSYEDTIEIELETGHVITQCKHQLEWCPKCCLDFRELNEMARRESAATTSQRDAKEELGRIPQYCRAAGCTKEGKYLCQRCHKVGYCSKECQTADWKRHKKEDCKALLPTFVNSFSQKTITTYPILTEIEMMGGTSPVRAKILKFNPGRSSNPTSDDLATYSLKQCKENGKSYGETWEEVAEDVHDPQQWKVVH